MLTLICWLGGGSLLGLGVGLRAALTWQRRHERMFTHLATRHYELAALVAHNAEAANEKATAILALEDRVRRLEVGACEHSPEGNRIARHYEPGDN